MSGEVVPVVEAVDRHLARPDAANASAGCERPGLEGIPFDWHWTTITRLLAAGGSIKTGPFGTVLKAHEYSTEGVPIISVGEIGLGSLKVTENTPMAPPAVVRRLPEYSLKAGDIVFGRKGAVDRSALIDATQDGWFLGSDGIRLRLPANVHPAYVARQFQRQSVRTWLQTNAVGTTMASLNQAVLSSVSLPIAPFPEQRAIAEALSDVDGLLGALDALIGKKRAIKQAVMQQLLTGKTRLPGFGGDWKTMRLGEFGHWRGGLTPSMANPLFWSQGEIPWLTSSDVREGWIDPSSARITQRAVKETGVPVVRANSVVVVIRSGILRRFLPVATTPGPVAINQDLRALEPGWQHDSRFLVYALVMFERRILQDCLKAGTTVESIDSRWFKEFDISMPQLAEQQAIATVLSDMDSELAALEARRDKTRAIKQGMMQQLLTGRVRLVKPAPPEASA